MAGHSKFKNIQHRKGAQDKKRAKLFTQAIKEIVVAAKQGSPSLEMNSKLRHAVQAARKLNVPKDRIENAIKQATSPGNSSNYTEMRYEGFWKDGISVIVEALTDNKNRAASSVRSLFTKHGGQLGETGSVNFMFEHLGFIVHSREEMSKTEEELFEIAIEAGCLDVAFEEESITFYTPVEGLHVAVDKLTVQIGESEEVYIGWRPKNLIQITNKDQAIAVLKLIDDLEELDDVNRTFSNFDITHEVLQSLS